MYVACLMVMAALFFPRCYRTCKKALSGTSCSVHTGLVRPQASLSTR
jgi:hypothetical protein